MVREHAPSHDAVDVNASTSTSSYVVVVVVVDGSFDPMVADVVVALLPAAVAAAAAVEATAVDRPHACVPSTRCNAWRDNALLCTVTARANARDMHASRCDVSHRHVVLVVVLVVVVVIPARRMTTAVDTAAALARSSYRALVRAIVNNPPRTTTTTMRSTAEVVDDAHAGPSPPPPPPRLAISLRARGVLLDRVCAIARDDLASTSRDAAVTGAGRGVEAFAASCVMATHFFRAAHADEQSPEARHARAAVGYLDGYHRHARRSRANGAVMSKRALKAARAKASVDEAWRDVLSASAARLVGLPRALMATDA